MNSTEAGYPNPDDRKNKSSPPNFANAARKLLNTPKEKIKWPTGDKPDAGILARIFYLVYQNVLTNPQQFWINHTKHIAEGKTLIYCEFETENPTTNYAKPKCTTQAIEEGLEIWRITNNVVFNETLTSFYGVGKENLRNGKMPEGLSSWCDWDFNTQQTITAYNSQRSHPY